MFTLIVFIVILGLLVFVHELGHFLVARRNGIKVEEFGLGFPPRAIGFYFDEKKDKDGSVGWRIVKGDEQIETENTLYSLNWFPIGGFVRIKGEAGEDKKDKDSFASKSAWVRTKVLVAGVMMNFILAWVLFSVTFMMGTYQDATGQNIPGSKIVISGIEYGSPAQKMDLRTGDVLLGNDLMKFSTVLEVQNYIAENKGKEITLNIERGGKLLTLKGVPREKVEANQGLLGISQFAEVVTKKLSFFEALWEGLREIGTFFVMFGLMIAQLFKGNGGAVDAVGPVGIVLFTGKIIPLGLAYVLRFVAVLSVNLGIINILPIPALDGGRLLFIIIEKIKGSKVKQSVEHLFNSVGMAILLLLMLFVTIKEILSPEVIDKFKSLF